MVVNNVERELHLERLLGRRVRDVEGVVIGRIEEVLCEVVNSETVVAELHIGPAAVAERLGGFLLQLPLVRMLPFPRWEYRIPWEAFDVSDVDRPTITLARRELRRVEPDVLT